MDPATIFVLLRRFWPAVPILLLSVALMLAIHSRKNVKAELEQSKQQRVRVEESLKVTIASLQGATAQINDNNRRIRAAAARFDQAKQQAAADLARANARWEATGRTVNALEASARNNSLPPCRMSERALDALKGL